MLGSRDGLKAGGGLLLHLRLPTLPITFTSVPAPLPPGRPRCAQPMSGTAAASVTCCSTLLVAGGGEPLPKGQLCCGACAEAGLMGLPKRLRKRLYRLIDARSYRRPQLLLLACNSPGTRAWVAACDAAAAACEAAAASTEPLDCGLAEDGWQPYHEPLTTAEAAHMHGWGSPWVQLSDPRLLASFREFWQARAAAAQQRRERAAATERQRAERAAAAERQRQERAAAAERQRAERAAAAERQRQERAAAAERQRAERAAAAERQRQERAAAAERRQLERVARERQRALAAGERAAAAAWLPSSEPISVQTAARIHGSDSVWVRLADPVAHAARLEQEQLLAAARRAAERADAAWQAAREAHQHWRALPVSR